MGVITKNILIGLITILPITLTLYVLYWLAVSTEGLLGGFLVRMLPADMYRPGFGVLVALTLCFLIGMLMHIYVVQRLFSLGEGLFLRLPLIRSVYPMIRDFFEYFSPMKKKDFEKVVAVTLPNLDLEVVGLVTQTNLDRMPEGFGHEDCVLVYLPMSYMIGGYTAVVPRERIRELDITMDEAMRFILTAGVAGIDRRDHEHSVPTLDTDPTKRNP